MKLRYGAAIVIFVSSYTPLIVMLAIFDFNFTTWQPNNPIANWMALGLVALSVSSLTIVMRTLHGDYVVQVTAVKDRSNELLNYALPYVASFYSGGGLSNPNFLVALGFFLCMIGWISIRTQIVLINPLLACVGYGLFEISYKDGQGTHERIVLSRTSPEAGKPLKIAPLTPFFIFGEKAFNSMKKPTKLLKELQSNAWDEAEALLWIVHSKLRNREAQYETARVKTTPELQKRLAQIVASEIRRARHLDPYQYVTGDLDENDALFLDDKEHVDFRDKILPQIDDRTDAGEVKSIEELYGANAYIIDLTSKAGGRVFAFKKIPEKWDSTTKNRLFSAIWRNLKLEEAEDQEVFRLSRTVDSFHYQGWSFILNKKNFEAGLNFRVGMARHAEELVNLLGQHKTIANPQALLEGNENNLRVLRSLAQVMKNPRFKDPQWITRVKELNTQHGWKIQFQDDSILLNDDNLTLIIMLLRDRRAMTLIFGEMIDADVAHVVVPKAS